MGAARGKVWSVWQHGPRSWGMVCLPIHFRARMDTGIKDNIPYANIIKDMIGTRWHKVTRDRWSTMPVKTAVRSYVFHKENGFIITTVQIFERFVSHKNTTPKEVPICLHLDTLIIIYRPIWENNDRSPANRWLLTALTRILYLNTASRHFTLVRVLILTGVSINVITWIDYLVDPFNTQSR